MSTQTKKEIQATSETPAPKPKAEDYIDKQAKHTKTGFTGRICAYVDRADEKHSVCIQQPGTDGTPDERYFDLAEIELV